MDGDLNFLLLFIFGKSHDHVSLEIYWRWTGLCVLYKVGGTAVPQEWKGKDGPRVTQGPGVELGILSSKLAFLFGASQHRLLRLLGGLLEATRALCPSLESTNCSRQVEELLWWCFYLGQSSISLGSCWEREWVYGLSRRGGDVRDWVKR